jgi:hypothetical protein
MNPDEIEAMLRDNRPEPPPGLRERVLAAAARVERRPPWWARVSTWSSAAAALLLCNWLVMTESSAPAAQPEPTHQYISLSSEEAEDLPPFLAARLRQPLPPMRSNAPTPFTPIEELLR